MTLAVNKSQNQTMQASDVGGRGMGAFKQRFDEAITYQIDYSQWLADGETISTATYFVTPTTSPAAIITGAVIQDGNQALFQFDNGVDGQKYVVTVDITTSTGQVKVDTFTVLVGISSSEGAASSVETSVTLANVARVGAETAQAGAVTAKTAAEAARDGSISAKNASEIAAAAANVARTEAYNSANTATSKANEAAASANSASSNATVATNKASEASGSATSAAASAATATTKASEASSSATSAAASAATATTKASEASTASTTAQTKATEASASATNAAASATTSTTKASEAAASATAASGSASTSSTKASEAAASATAAATSASSANTSKLAAQAAQTAAAAAQVAAESARDSALSAYDSFDDRYLGPKASDPTTDNDGNPLLGGALYFNTVSQSMKLYTGSAWVNAYVSGDIALLKANNLSDLPSVATARSNLGLTALATTAPGTGVAAALAIAIGTAGALVTNGGALGTPASGTLTNCSGLPAAGVTGLATVATSGAYSSLSGLPTLGSLAALSSINNSNWSGTQLSVANGGTGLQSLTSGQIPYGNGTGAFGNSANLTFDGTNITVGGKVASGGSGVNGYFQLNRSDANNLGSIEWITASDEIRQTNRNGGIHTFYVGASEKLRIASDGSVGIGTSSPGYKLDVNGTINTSGGIVRVAGNTNPYLVLNDGTYNAYLQITGGIFNAYTASIPMTFSPGGSLKMTLDASGNLGLGVSPSAWPGQSASYYVAQIGKGAIYDAGAAQLRLTYNGYVSSVGTNTYIATGYATRYDQSAGQHIWYNAPSGTAGSAISFTQAMTLDAGGNLLVGTTSADGLLTVAGVAKGGIVHRKGTYTAGSTTPSVAGISYLSISNSSATTITNFTNGVDGQIIYLYFNDANTTVNRNNAYLAGGANFVSTASDTLVLMNASGVWVEISRSANS